MSVLARKVLAVAAAGILLAGCAANGPVTRAPVQDCRPGLERSNAQLAAEVAEQQRLLKAAVRREEALKKEIEALKSIERAILDREERKQSRAR
ncbi:MAG: hypothetical protein AB1452_02750 [Pseudomonadota bacterium]